MNMKKIISMVLLVLLSAGLFAETSAVVKSFSGKVEIRTPGSGWAAVQSGQRIPTGATISTGFRSEAVLEVGTATLEVKPLTRMRLDELIEKEGTVKTDLYLRVGRVKANVSRTQGLQNDFRLRSPVSTAAVRGTSFTYDGTTLDVDEGLVAMGNSYGQTAGVPAGISITANGIEVPPGTIAALNEMFDVNISAAQLEDILAGFDLSGFFGGGGVAIVWSLVGGQALP